MIQKVIVIFFPILGLSARSLIDHYKIVVVSVSLLVEYELRVELVDHPIRWLLGLRVVTFLEVTLLLRVVTFPVK